MDNRISLCSLSTKYRGPVTTNNGNLGVIIYTNNSLQSSKKQSKIIEV